MQGWAGGLERCSHRQQLSRRESQPASQARACCAAAPVQRRLRGGRRTLTEARVSTTPPPAMLASSSAAQHRGLSLSDGLPAVLRKQKGEASYRWWQSPCALWLRAPASSAGGPAHPASSIGFRGTDIGQVPSQAERGVEPATPHPPTCKLALGTRPAARDAGPTLTMSQTGMQWRSPKNKFAFRAFFRPVFSGSRVSGKPGRSRPPTPL